MSSVLARWNLLSAAAAMNEILPCCGSRAWASQMVDRRPHDEAALLATSDQIWSGLSEIDWQEAFNSHPRIGESGGSEPQVIGLQSPKEVRTHSASWSAEEQRNVTQAGESVKLALAEANRIYEKRFHRIFIVCATGKSPSEILKILRKRLENDDATEIREAAEQQRQITQIRLRKWLEQ